MTQILEADAIVVGGGISGLVAAWQLHRHGVEVLLLEGRERLGGRIRTVEEGEGHFDLGPSWVWHGQPHVAALLRLFAIPSYEQYCQGDLLYQHTDGALVRDAELKPMRGALRVRGGLQAQVEAMARELPAERRRLHTRVQELVATEAGIRLVAGNAGGQAVFRSKQVALAIPLRLASGLAFEPSLDTTTMRLLRSTPTWMAGQAKFFAIYDEAFWRRQGLSGDALSQRGPLVEIHDASPPSSGPYALFGFVGLDAPARQKRTRPRLIEAAVAQLVDLFGAEAAAPRQVHLMDWSEEKFTANADDQHAPSHHPNYGIDVPLQSPWRGALHFIVSETATENGGLVEGGLQRGFQFAEAILKSRKGAIEAPATDAEADPHKASMSWSWLSDEPR